MRSHDAKAGAEPGRRRGLLRRSGRWIGRLILVFLILVVVLGAAGSIYQAVAASRDLRRFPPPGRMVDVGGFRLHLDCRGEGSPTVVFDGPTGSSSLGWSLVQPGVSTFTRACSYDRAGYAWSDPGPRPRTSERIASEMEAILQSGGVEGPLVLVGSSFGGLNVRLVAGRIQDRISGMVLVDSAHEDQFRRLSAKVRVSAAEIRILSLFRVLSRIGLLRLAGIAIGEGSAGSLPEDLRPAARAVGFRPSWIDAISHEAAALDESLAQVREGRSRGPRPFLGNRPLVVLTHGVSDDVSAEGIENERIWSDLQKDLLTLSARSAHVIAEKSGHFIQADQPDLIVEAIRQVVEGSRDAASRPPPGPQVK